MRIDRGPPVIVLDMSVGGLGIARSLGREGIPVVGVDFSEVYRPGLQSRYCLPFLSSHPEREPRPLLEFLVKLAEQLHGKAVLCPESEPYARFVSEFRKELEPHFLFAIPSREIMDSVLDKRKQYDLARSIGVLHPATYSLENQIELEEAKDKIEYPALIKPCYSKGVWNDRYAGVKGFMVSNPADLASVWKRLSAEKLPVFAQSIVRGPDSNVFELYVYMSKSGVPIATFVTRKIRQYPVMFGNGTLMVSVHDDEVLRFGMKFFKGIGYCGLGSIEVKKDDRDGECKLIELNPRLGVQNAQATNAGLNFPLIEYADLTGSPIRPMDDYKDGVKWLDMTHDVLAFIALSRCRRLSVDTWFRSISNVDCHAYFARDDLKPFLKQYATRLVRIPRYFARRFSTKRATRSSVTPGVA